MAIRKRNGRWLATIYVGREPGPDGKERRVERSQVFDLKKAAEAWLAEQKALLVRGEWAPPAKQTLGEYLDQWERGALKLGPQRERTKASYRELLRLYVRPKLGHVRLDRLTKPLVQQAAAELLAQTRTAGGKPEVDETGKPRATISPVTVRRALAALSVALSAAVDARLMTSNPAQGVSLPRREREPTRWLTREHVGALIEGTQEDRHGVLWLVLAYTGLRPGEALGLAWEHMDLEAGVLRVQRALGRTTMKDDKQGWALAEPKTRRSRRAVPLPEPVVRALKAHRARQAAERLAAGETYRQYGEGGFVFARADGAPYRADAINDALRRTLKRLGLPHAPLYGLRHTAASLRLHAGVPLKVVSDLLGHSSIVLTADTYSHVTDSLQQAAAETFMAYMSAPEAKERKA
jgi:integrase